MVKYNNWSCDSMPLIVLFVLLFNMVLASMLLVEYSVACFRDQIFAECTDAGWWQGVHLHHIVTLPVRSSLICNGKVSDIGDIAN